MGTQTLEAMVSALEATANFRVLRRLDPARICRPDDLRGQLKIAAAIDVETTGLDPARDEIIQLAIVPFRYLDIPEAYVVEVLPEFNRYRQPSRPIGRAITELTGIDDACVAGHRLQPEEVQSFLSEAGVQLIIAHNAKFDRAFLERFCPMASTNCAWACSMTQVPWGEEAVRGRGLAFLAMQMGWFVRSHDALEDCRTVVALLNHPLPVSGRTALSRLLERETMQHSPKTGPASKCAFRIRAVGARFECKDVLKTRGYRWCSGSDGEPRAWYIDVLAEKRADEIAYLEAGILGPHGTAVVESLQV